MYMESCDTSMDVSFLCLWAKGIGSSPVLNLDWMGQSKSGSSIVAINGLDLLGDYWLTIVYTNVWSKFGLSGPIQNLDGREFRTPGQKGHVSEGAFFGTIHDTVEALAWWNHHCHSTKNNAQGNLKQGNYKFFGAELVLPVVSPIQLACRAAFRCLWHNQFQLAS